MTVEHKIILLLLAHFVSDFIVQTDWVAANKSKQVKVLALHVFLYSLPLLFWGVAFAGANLILHFITDAISSRFTSYFWKKEKRHMFFVVIGADQFIHATCLILTMHLMR